MTDYIWKAPSKGVLKAAMKAANIRRPNEKGVDEDAQGGTLADGTTWAAFDIDVVRKPTGRTVKVVDLDGKLIDTQETVAEPGVYLIGRANGDADMKDIFTNAKGRGAELVWSSDMVDAKGEPVPRPDWIGNIL